jgi:hypothetical protein
VQILIQSDTHIDFKDTRERPLRSTGRLPTTPPLIWIAEVTGAAERDFG